MSFGVTRARRYEGTANSASSRVDHDESAYRAQQLAEAKFEMKVETALCRWAGGVVHIEPKLKYASGQHTLAYAEALLPTATAHFKQEYCAICYVFPLLFVSTRSISKLHYPGQSVVPELISLHSNTPERRKVIEFCVNATGTRCRGPLYGGAKFSV